MAKHALSYDPASSPHEARLRHERRVAAARSKLETANAK